jgi:hypothetical protein
MGDLGVLFEEEQDAFGVEPNEVHRLEVESVRSCKESMANGAYD